MLGGIHSCPGTLAVLGLQVRYDRNAHEGMCIDYANGMHILEHSRIWVSGEGSRTNPTQMLRDDPTSSQSIKSISFSTTLVGFCFCFYHFLTIESDVATTHL